MVDAGRMRINVDDASSDALRAAELGRDGRDGESTGRRQSARDA